MTQDSRIPLPYRTFPRFKPMCGFERARISGYVQTRDRALRSTEVGPANGRKRTVMLALIDNYDSFTYNLVHFLGELGAETAVYRNDAISAADIVFQNPAGIVISPGPCNPDKAGISLDIVAAAEKHGIPLLGVCLGHQSIGQHFGGKVVQAPSIMHGKVGEIRHTGVGVFEGLPSPLKATRYHSLVVDRASLPECLEVTAETENDIIMGLQHRDLPIHGVQFHPESIATEHGHALLRNFLTFTQSPWRQSSGRQSSGQGAKAA